MQRVLMDARVDTGGVGRYADDLIREMTSLENAPEVAVVRRGKSSVQRVAGTPFTPWGRAYVGHRARTESADLIHGLHFELPLRPNVPKVVTIPDLIPLLFPASMPSRLRRWVFRRLIPLSLERATQVIVPSPHTADALSGFSSTVPPVVAIPIGCNPIFRPASSDGADRARKRFARGRRYVASVVGPKQHKNPEVLAAAARGLLDMDVVFVCRGHPRSDPGDVVWLEDELPDDELAAFYGGADAFVLPSLIEGYGLPVLEALACGTPVVCGPHVGVLAYVRAGVLEVDVSDPSAIADALRRLLVDESLRGELTAEGLVAASSLTLGRTARETAEVYAALG